MRDDEHRSVSAIVDARATNQYKTLGKAVDADSKIRSVSTMDPNRNQPIGALRLCVTLLVLVHHSILAYCQTGHFDHLHYLWSSAPIVDRQRWIGFDILEDYNDTYFMSLMFLVSGLFVLSSLQRKGIARYARDRLWRLGLPFAACVTLIMPVAYYPSILQTGVDLSFAQFWAGYFTRYGWPGGPAWFIWFLLALDLLSCIVLRVWPSLPKRAASVPDRILAYPVHSLLLLLAAGMLAYLPLEAIFGPSAWFRLGPFAAQDSRVGLYALFFCVGASVGASGIHHRLFTRQGPVARGWIGCLMLALIAFGLLLVLQIAALHQRGVLSGAHWQAFGPILFVVCCVFSSIALAGLFLRHVERGHRWADRLAANAYGIYLLHYVFLTWAQAALLAVPWGAVPKAAAVFLTVLGSSWAVTALLRLSPTVRRVL